MFKHLRMVLACQNYLVKSQKFWDWGDPPTPCWEKLPNNPVFFFMQCSLRNTMIMSPGRSQTDKLEMKINQFLPTAQQRELRDSGLSVLAFERDERVMHASIWFLIRILTFRNILPIWDVCLLWDHDMLQWIRRIRWIEQTGCHPVDGFN